MNNDSEVTFSVTWKPQTQKTRKTLVFNEKKDAELFYKEKEDKKQYPALYVSEKIISTRLVKSAL